MQVYLKIHSADEDVKTFFKLKFENMTQKRKEEIISPYNETVDENVGGGRSGKRVVRDEIIAVKLATDKTLIRYKDILKDIEPLYDNLEEYEKEILKAFYLNASDVKHRRNTVKKVCKTLRIYTKEEVSSVRAYFLNTVAIKRGLIEYD